MITPERRRWRRPGVIIVNFEHISHLVLVFLLLNLSRQMPAGGAAFYQSNTLKTYLRHCQIFMMELFRENSQQLKAVNYFRKKAPSLILDGVLNMLLNIILNLSLISPSSLFSINTNLYHCGLFLTPENTIENKRFSYVLRGVQKETSA